MRLRLRLRLLLLRLRAIDPVVVNVDIDLRRLAAKLRRLAAKLGGLLLLTAAEALPSLKEVLLTLHELRPVVRLRQVVAAHGRTGLGDLRVERLTVAEIHRLRLLLIRKALIALITLV